MNLIQRALVWILLVVGSIYIVLRLWISDSPIETPISSGNLVERLELLEEKIGQQNARLEQIRLRHDNLVLRGRRVEVLNKNRTNKTLNSVGNVWHKPIAVLVFVCDRASALKAQLKKLISYRKSKSQFPIIVSQDCDNQEVVNVAKSFESEVEYVKHESGQKAKIVVPPEHKHFKSYYLISRHYNLGLSHVFDQRGFDSVIILEDDLDISSDFFDFFAGTRWLLDEDPSLFCISAWNDNGRPSLIDLTAHDRLYRSDFFPGLGWLMTKNLWSEFGPKWPSGFWDDWIRDPARRRKRSCIRPEISRTAMTTFGKKGASRGLFFNYYLKKIFLNDVAVEFTALNQSSLLKSNYDHEFIDHVYQLPTIQFESFIKLKTKGAEYRITYQTMAQYTSIAKGLRLMADTKAGVPRTAYKGIVTCFVKGNRVFLAPKDPSRWTGYDSKWEAPGDVLSPIDKENEEP
ncbi:hypothetical protein M3Y98_01132900 [Aphelenchoides besseyi]|nr:hypothetical protein M3Y98_01132900 [Aphelenchoides besseyi]KAI6210606.1 hypothetical protein M3Y96_00345900 [Aphelenchoides besseyi]